MKTRADVEALRRELETRIRVLSSDTVFMSDPLRGPIVIRTLRDRLKLVDMIRENLTLLDWLVNPATDVKRQDLVDQDKI